MITVFDSGVSAGRKIPQLVLLSQLMTMPLDLNGLRSQRGKSQLLEAQSSCKAPKITEIVRFLLCLLVSEALVENNSDLHLLAQLHMLQKCFICHMQI